MKCVYLRINKCNECPHMDASRYYTADSFENCYQWKCKLSNMRSIAVLDMHDPDPEIPKWCKLRVRL